MLQPLPYQAFPGKNSTSPFREKLYNHKKIGAIPDNPRITPITDFKL
jgi:hypothetical protein